MIIKKSIAVPVIILMILFTSTFVSLNSIYSMPQKIMGENNVYVLTSSTDKNPLRSNLNVNLAFALENTTYIEDVSPEIFVFTTLNGEPVTIRGVIFSKFLKIENGKIIDGKIPQNKNDAMVGVNLFNHLHLHVGENITLRGSFQPSIAIVRITGVFQTNDPADDEIMVGLSTAQTLAGLKRDTVSIIRFQSNNVGETQKLMDPAYPKFKVTLNSTGQVYFGDKFNATVRINNMGSQPGYCKFNLIFQDQRIERNLYVKNNISFNVTLKARYVGTSKINVSVENDVLNYVVSSQISVLERPVVFKGKVLTYVGTPTEYAFKSINVTINNATLKVYGMAYFRVYHFNGSINLTFPKEGEYLLYFEKYGFENKTIEVKVFKRMPFGAMASISPNPINNIIFLEKGERIFVSSRANSIIFYSIDGTSIQRTSSNISIIGQSGETHILDVYVVTGWIMENATYLVHLCDNKSLFVYSPINNESVVYYKSNFTINVWSEIPLKNVSIYVNRYRHDIHLNQEFNKYVDNYTYNFTVNVKYKNFEVEIYAANMVNVTSHLIIKPKVLYSSDIIKPIIIVGSHRSENELKSFRNREAYTVNVWSGQSFTIKAMDNFQIRNLTVYIFNKYFNASAENSGITTLSVTVPTMFVNGTCVVFMREGIYRGEIIAIDSSGNVNETNLNVIINNTGEKLPPLILGPTLLNFNSPGKYGEFHICDNVGVKYVTLYENDTIIKNVSFGGASTGIFYLNHSDLNEGYHNLTLAAVDVNGNIREINIIALKNYTDSEAPEIIVPKTKIFGGEYLIIKAKDNVRVKRLAVLAFGGWHNTTGNKILIPTEFKNNTLVTFIKPGEYYVKIYAWDVFGNLNFTGIIIEINNERENIPPVIIPSNVTKCNASRVLRFKAFDNVGVAIMWIEVDNLPVVENSSGNLSFRADKLGYGIVDANVFAMDVNGNVAMVPYRVLVMDNIPPRILNTTFKIWGGNTSKILLSDNIGVYQGVLYFMGYELKNKGDSIEVPTMFREGDNITYLKDGIYYGFAKVEDLSGNINSTHIKIIINNTNEKNPPVILGNAYNIINKNSSAVFKAFDNVGVLKMWCMENGTVLYTRTGSVLNLSLNNMPFGIHRIIVYAEDVNGNVANMSAEIDVTGIARYIINATLYHNEIDENQRGVLNIEIKNGINPGNCTIKIYLDNNLYANLKIYLSSYETKTYSIQLPYLQEGTHVVEVNNISLTLKVSKNPVEKLPLDLLLKYDKNLKVTGGKSVIYKGFQISEGNFMLIVYSLITIALILVALGLYSSLLKGIKDENVAILRAIGASNKNILKMAMVEILIYLTPSIVGGVLLGFALVAFMQQFDLMRAFGHELLININESTIVASVAITLFFLLFSVALIFAHIFHSGVMHLMGSEDSTIPVNLEEVLE